MAKGRYDHTINLMKTDFPMRANLPEREPEILKLWEEMGIYQRVQEQNQGRPKFILHDGPPYANGHIHLGHALNKVLKDIIIKFHTATGYDAPYVPGWDTHGLPIEQQAIKALGIDRHHTDVVEFRRYCKEYALKYMDIQRREFKRLGVRVTGIILISPWNPDLKPYKSACSGNGQKRVYLSGAKIGLLVL